MKPFGAAHDRAALRFRTRRLRRSRVPVDPNTVVLVQPLDRVRLIGRRDDDLVSGRAKAARQAGHVDFGTAPALGIIPADTLHDSHWTDDCGITYSPLASTGVPANASRRGGRR